MAGVAGARWRAVMAVLSLSLEPEAERWRAAALPALQFFRNKKPWYFFVGGAATLDPGAG